AVSLVDVLSGNSPRKKHAWRKLPLGIDRALDGAHFFDAGVPVERPEKLLLHRIAADAMLRKGRSAQPYHFPPERQDGGFAGVDVRDRSRDYVRVNVAVRDVSPDGRI